MGVQPGASGGYYNLGSSTDMDFPAGEISWAIWTRSSSISGVNWLLNQQPGGGKGARIWWQGAGILKCSVSATSYVEAAGTVNEDDGTWVFAVVQRTSGGNCQLKYIHQGSTTVVTKTSAGSAGTGAQTVADNMLVGESPSLGGTGCPEADIAEVFKCHEVWTDEEMRMVAGGTPPVRVKNEASQYYFPFIEHFTGAPQPVISSAAGTITVGGTGQATAEHPPAVWFYPSTITRTTAGGITVEVALTLTATPALTALADATSEAAVSLAASAGLTFNGLVTAEGALAMQTVTALMVTGDATVEGSMTLGTVPGLVTNAGQVLTGDVSLGATPGLVMAGDISIEAALALAMTTGVGTVATVTAEAVLPLAAIATMGIGAGAAAEAGLDLATTHAMQVVAQAVAEAGLSLDAVTGIVTVGEQVIISVEVSPGRTIQIRVESRVILASAENRTIIVDAENRTIEVKDAGQ